jgi:hypothetical protein
VEKRTKTGREICGAGTGSGGGMMDDGIDRPKFLLLEINQTASARAINKLIEAIRWDYKDVVKSIKRSEE